MVADMGHVAGRIVGIGDILQKLGPAGLWRAPRLEPGASWSGWMASGSYDGAVRVWFVGMN